MSVLAAEPVKHYALTGIVLLTIGHYALKFGEPIVRCQRSISVPHFPLRSLVKVAAMRTKTNLGVRHTQALLMQSSLSNILVIPKSGPPAEHGRRSYCHTFEALHELILGHAPGDIVLLKFRQL